FNAVSDTPNSRCFRHRNHTPSKVPGSISSASDLQIGHITIANFPDVGAAHNYTPVRLGQRHSIINTCLSRRSQALAEACWRDRSVGTRHPKARNLQNVAYGVDRPTMAKL